MDDHTSAIQDVRDYAAAFVRGRDGASEGLKDVVFPLSALFYRIVVDLDILPQSEIDRLLCVPGK